MEATKCFKCGERHWSSQPCKVPVGKKAALKKAVKVLEPGSIVPDSRVKMAGKKRGRKKVYVSNAEKQRAYRARKTKGAEDGS